MLKKYLGQCKGCKQDVYSMDGFLNGVYDPVAKSLYCYVCGEEVIEDVEYEYDEALKT
ncbi:hypothetical protein B0H94_102159 [Salsuginibacillus halophilus]|uniref:Uncharacterized protein n=1 Tax=Salsuginibacillus halophilus TaxID=517424 RepID=A0A2P8HXD6_9BACI|nr:hypothetical protein B0H94_102159 [Salsuginibacillus halophilus]